MALWQIAIAAVAEAPRRLKPTAVALAICGLLPVGVGAQAAAEPRSASTESRESITAFINVHVIPMQAGQLLRDRVVIVEGDRITAIRPQGAVSIPDDARVIDGEGRYLLPGLTDAHVHLDGDGTAHGTTRDDFGDAPLYLAYGVTTVFNLRGLPEHLEWRRRIEAGEWLGPTIYTAGEFINEPRVHTPADVREEIARQVADGYDLIKFHEIYTREDGDVTTTGLPPATYTAMNEAAQELGIPLVGHAPVNLDLEALLAARQPLAHLGAISQVYFLPIASSRAWVIVTVIAFSTLLLLAATSGIVAIVRSRQAVPRATHRVSYVRIFADSVLLTSVLAGASAVLVLPGGPLFDSGPLRVVFTTLCLMLAIMATLLLVITVSSWHAPDVSRSRRLQASIAAIVGLVLSSTALAFWVPLAWRSSDAGIEWVAERIRAAGISVQTTLVAYDAVAGPGKAHLAGEPALGFLRSDVQDRWLRFAKTGFRGYRYTDFLKKVALALNRAGVPLIVGTDAMGFPLVTPGASIHRELELLVEAGIEPYEAIRGATVLPARFLRRQDEFGSIAVGRRADMILVDGNPVEDITRLRNPAGVMVRGHWLPRSQLQKMLTELTAEE